MLQNRPTQGLPIHQRIHAHSIKAFIPLHKLIPRSLVKSYRCLIARKHMQPHLCATCYVCFALHPLHQSSSQAASSKLRRNIQRHHISHAFPLCGLHVRDAKPCQHPVRLRNDNLCPSSLGKRPHLSSRKPERFLEAHYIQRIHCIQITGPVSTKQKITHDSIISAHHAWGMKERKGKARQGGPV